MGEKTQHHRLAGETEKRLEGKHGELRGGGVNTKVNRSRHKSHLICSLPRYIVRTTVGRKKGETEQRGRDYGRYQISADLSLGEFQHHLITEFESVLTAKKEQSR